MNTHFCTQCQTYIAPGQAVCSACGAPRPPAAPVVPRWTASLVRAPGEMLAAGDLLLVPDQQGALRALVLVDGHRRWEVPFAYAAVGGLTRAGERILVATYSTDLLRGEGCVVALDLDGGEDWRWVSGGRRVSAPAVCGGRAYVTLDTRVLVALDLATGQEAARISLAGQATPAAPRIGDGAAYLACRGPYLLAVGLDGGAGWRFDLEGEDAAWLDQTPLQVGDGLYCVSTTGTLVSLDSATGALRWNRAVGPPGKALTAPVTEDGRLFVGARDGVHALDLAGGEEWFFATGRKVSAAPAVADGVVYAAAHDHHLYALDAVSGKEWWRVELDRRIEVRPVVGDELVLAADREGHIAAVERILDAEGYAQRGLWPEAASAHIRAGRLAEAARICKEQLAQPRHAAELWRAAGDLARAAPLYVQAQAYERAEACYAQLGQPLRVAEMARRQGDLARAAALYRAEGAWREARDCYAEAGDRRAVAELSERLGEWPRAAQTWEALGEWARAGDAYRQARDPARAAPLYERAGAFSRAAACYEEAGQWAEAAALYERSGCVDDAVRCHRLAGQWRRAGALERARGQFAAAAEAFMRAAQSPERASDRAALWSAAEGCCLQAGNEAQAAACRIEVARHRGQPYIELQVTAPERMVKDQFVLLACHLRNVGGARPARSLCATSPTILRASWNRPRRCATWRPARRCRLYSRSAHGSAARCRSRSMSITAIRRARWRASRTARGST